MNTWCKKYTVIVGVALAVFFAYDLTPWTDPSAAVWATWTGSLGTVGTLIGTVYLATTQERERRRDRLITARLLAAGMKLQLAHAKSMLGGILRVVEDCNRRGVVTKRDRELLLNLVCQIDVWHSSELVPLIVLPDGLAVNLVTIATHCRALKKGFELMAPIPDEATQLPTDALNTELERALKDETIDLIDKAMHQCSKAAEHLVAEAS